MPYDSKNMLGEKKSNMCDCTSSLAHVLELVDDNTYELAISKHLNEINQ